MRSSLKPFALGLALLSIGVFFTAQGMAQIIGTETDAEQLRAQMDAALRESYAASERSQRLEEIARGVKEAADSTAREAAVLAAHIQQTEAGIAAQNSKLALIRHEQHRLDQKFASEQAPLVRLTAALQKISRRPLALSAFQPGSLRQAVYVRAMLAATMPEVRRRTETLRARIAERARLANEAEMAIKELKLSDDTLVSRRKALAVLETRQRLEVHKAGGDADREVERAIALAEQARDLDSLVGRLDDNGALRSELAALSGPVLRPNSGSATPSFLGLGGGAEVPAPATKAAKLLFDLPVMGRTISGFGEVSPNGIRTSALTLGVQRGAQLTAPAPGRVAFAGTYKGYGEIVIIEHEQGFISLITGLGRVTVTTGDSLVEGAPIGIAGAGNGEIGPKISFELRRGGVPVNPVTFIR